MNILDFYVKFIDERKINGTFRELKDCKCGACVDFSSNDYLMLSKSSEVLLHAIEAGRKYGVGGTGSRLLSGNCPIFTDFEKQIADDTKMESALLFCSGYQANISTLSALCDVKKFASPPIIFFDKLNHASLYAAAHLSGAELVRYVHNDMSNLKMLLEKYDSNRPKFIVSETVFGMDGDVANVDQLALLAKNFDALLYLDRAHESGVLNCIEHCDFSQTNYVLMGTFSKALGCSGAYISCSTLIKEYLLQQCSGFIYSTSPSPMIIGAAKAAWNLSKKMDAARERILHLAQFFRNSVTDFGFCVGNSTTHIVPILLKSNESVQYAINFLIGNIQRKNDTNFSAIVSGIRTPTSPTPRLRIAFNASHTQDEAYNLINLLHELKKEIL